MQTAIDGNGSSSTTTITTIISSTVIKNENTPNSSRTQHHQNTQKNHQQYHQTHSLMQSKLPETEATNILKHNVNTNINTCTNFSAVPATENDLWHFLNAAESLFVTPSSTPQASPSNSKNIEEDFLTANIAGMQSIAISTPFQDVYRTNTSSNPTSTTSSVIATSVLKRNGKSEYTSEEINDEVIKDCEQLKESNNKELLINQRNPRIMKKEFTFCSFPISASTSSLSTSPTPASVATTPALCTTSLSSSSPPSSSSILTSSSSLSPLSSPSTESEMKRLSMSGIVAAELLQWQDMPQYLQFNPYVLKGYRPLTTFKGCLLSLFYWHNETINILTHAIPIVYILAIVPGLMPWENGYGFLSFCHIFGSVAPWCGSFVYHLFMNIEQGEYIYNRLLKLDMVGIWVSQSFGALPLLTASTFCFSFQWKWLIIISYCLLSFWGLYKALTASSPWQRRLCFGLPFVMRSILTYFRTIGLVGGNRVALEHVYLQDGVSIIGGAIGAMRIPEKWFPGLVDFYLNSHNIMHVLVVVAVYSMFKATMKDLEWMESANCNTFENITSKVLESSLNAKIDL